MSGQDTAPPVLCCLVSFAGLTSLQLRGCPRLTSSGLVALTALTGLEQLMVEACATRFGSGDADYAPDSIRREDFRLYSNVSCRGWLRYCALTRAGCRGSDTSTNQAAG
jgi:hypothetical protein